MWEKLILNRIYLLKHGGIFKKHLSPILCFLRYYQFNSPKDFWDGWNLFFDDTIKASGTEDSVMFLGIKIGNYMNVKYSKNTNQ